MERKHYGGANMSVIRIHKNKNFTVMGNIHLRDKELSLKAKGLLSVMLSLPDNWTYSIGGLCSICKENETAVKSTLKELKEKRYVIVVKHKPTKENNGRFNYEYKVYEEPQPEPIQEDHIQGVENLSLENLPVENHPLYKSTDISNTDLLNIDNIKDLYSPTELNSFSQEEKATSPMGLNSSISKRNKKGGENNPDKWIATKTHIEICMERNGHNQESFETTEIIEIVKAYYEKYREVIGQPHPRLNDKTMMYVIGQYLKGFGEGNTSVQTYRDLIDFHFATKYRETIDWTIQHFMSGEVREKLLYHNMP